MNTVKHKELESILLKHHKVKIPMFIWGEPGVGKSFIVEDCAKRNGLDWMDLRLTTLDPTDLRGLPSIKEGRTTWSIPDILPSNGFNGFLVFDEINLAAPSLQSASYQIIRERRLGFYTLPENCVCIAIGNKQSHGCGVFHMSKALENRFAHYDLESPTVNDWVKNFAAPNNIDGRIISYLMFSNRIMEFDPKSKEPQFPTPRMWEYCSKLISGENNIKSLVAATVGMGVAIEFEAFLKKAEEIDTDKVFDDVKLFVKLDTDMKFAISNSIVEKTSKDKTLMPKLIDYIVELKSKFPEFGATFIRLMVAKSIWGNLADKDKYKISENYSEFL